MTGLDHDRPGRFPRTVTVFKIPVSARAPHSLTVLENALGTIPVTLAVHVEAFLELSGKPCGDEVIPPSTTLAAIATTTVFSVRTLTGSRPPN